MGEIEDRINTYSDIRDILALRGYIVKSAYSNKKGEGMLELIDKHGHYYHMRLYVSAPSIFSEFLNDYQEVHAFAFGLIHSCTKLLPLKLSELDNYDDLSDENKADIRKENHYYKGAFWGLRIAVAIAAYILTGSHEVVLHLFGW